MKKIIFILLSITLGYPVFAQEASLIQAATQAAHGAGVAQQISRQVVAQLPHVAQPAVQLAQIANLPGKPLVQVRLDSPAFSAASILPARVLPPSQVYESISLMESGQLYVPNAFTETKNVLYRGMRFTKLSDLEDMLRQGMKIQRSAYSELYFAYMFSVAMDYALPWVVHEDIENLEVDFPVVVKLAVTTQLLEKRILQQTGVSAQVYKDLPAEFMTDVMVFLEINGQVNWYKAVVENNKLVLVSVPTTYAPGWLPRWIEP